MTDEQKKMARALRGSGLAKKELMRIVKGADQEEQRFMLRFFKTRKGFKERVFTPDEIAYCTGSHGDKAQSYAARFAAKEAFLKAIGTGLRGSGQLTEISVVNDDLGKPELKVTGYYASYIEKMGVKKIHLTLSHTSTTAMAVVVLE